MQPPGFGHKFDVPLPSGAVTKAGWSLRVSKPVRSTQGSFEPRTCVLLCTYAFPEPTDSWRLDAAFSFPSGTATYDLVQPVPAEYCGIVSEPALNVSVQS